MDIGFRMIMAVSLCGIMFVSEANAAPGDLDTTFDSNGIDIYATANDENGYDVVAPLLKPIFVGAQDDDALLGKDLSTGGLDTAFGGGDGLAIYGDSSLAYSFEAVTTDSSGRIVAVGREDGLDSVGMGNYLFVARFTSSGVLDTSFGSGGVVLFNDSDISILNDVAIDTNGKIVVTGSYSDNDFVSWIDGCLDDPAYCEAFAAVDGSSDWESYWADHFQTDVVVYRFTTDGDLDTSFSSDGRVSIDVGGEIDFATSLALTSSNEILVSGWTKADMIHGDADFFVMKLSGSGGLATSFGTSGVAITNLGVNAFGRSYDDKAYGMVAVSSGKLVVTGCSGLGSYDSSGNPHQDVSLVRYTSSGNLDTTFGGGDGIVKTSINTEDCAQDVAQQTVTAPSSNTYYVVGGYTNNGTNDDFALLRYTTSGNLDTTFGGGDGIVTHSVSSATDDDEKAFGITTDSNNRIVMVGEHCDTSDCDVMISRYKNN